MTRHENLTLDRSKCQQCGGNLVTTVFVQEGSVVERVKLQRHTCNRCNTVFRPGVNKNADLEALWKVREKLGISLSISEFLAGKFFTDEEAERWDDKIATVWHDGTAEELDKVIAEFRRR